MTSNGENKKSVVFKRRPRSTRPAQFQLFYMLVVLLLCGCANSQPAVMLTPTRTTTEVIPVLPTVRAVKPVPQPTLTAAPAAAAFTSTPTSIALPAPSSTSSPTPIPTYVKLRGEVIIDQAVCHYGPGVPYLYKYGVYKGSNLEILRRVEDGNYVEIQAIGGNNPCWVKVDYLKLKGELISLKPVRAEEVVLPYSPYYASPGGVSAKRIGDEVTVSWNALELRAGDDSEQTPYIIEAMVCRQGQLVFMPTGAFKTSVTIKDEPGCPEPSHARFIAAEKHGYTRPVDVPWPPAE
jgi:hypothetical protein